MRPSQEEPRLSSPPMTTEKMKAARNSTVPCFLMPTIEKSSLSTTVHREAIGVSDDKCCRDNAMLQSDRSRDSIGSRKRVRFADTLESTVIWVAPRSATETAACWWGRGESQESMRQSKSVAVSIREQDRRVMGTLHQFSYSSAVDIVHRKTMVSAGVSHWEKQLFLRWVASGHSRRGLEYWSVVGMKEARKNRKRFILGAVVRMYTKSRDPARVQALYEDMSRPSRDFARLMGEADEVAARREFQSLTNPAA